MQRTYRRKCRAPGVVVLAVAGACGASMVVGGAEPSARSREEAFVRHGEYVVRSVAMCDVCHSPKDDATGAVLEARLLEGAPVPLPSPYPESEWAFRAPRLAGLPGGWSADDLVRLLTTGRSRSGEPPQAPMPPFRMVERDARAVAAYLATLAE